jgi:hypothetical protein
MGGGVLGLQVNMQGRVWRGQGGLKGGAAIATSIRLIPSETS